MDISEFTLPRGKLMHRLQSRTFQLTILGIFAIMLSAQPIAGDEPDLRVVEDEAVEAANAIDLKSDHDGSVDIEIISFIPEEGGTWEAREPIGTAGEARSDFRVLPSRRQVVGRLDLSIDSRTPGRTTTVDGAGELQLAVSSSSCQTTHAIVTVDIYHTASVSAGGRGTVTLGGITAEFDGAYSDVEHHGYLVEVNGRVPSINVSGSATLHGDGILLAATNAVARVTGCTNHTGPGPAPNPQPDPDDDEDDPDDDEADTDGEEEDCETESEAGDALHMQQIGRAHV